MSVNITKEFGSTRSRKPGITNLVYGKVPPQAVPMEEAVLGAMMIDKSKQAEVFSLIQSDECFYADAHQKIYSAMIRLRNKSIPIDLLTVTEELNKSDELEIIGGAYYLTKLTSDVVTSAHVEAHAKTIIEKFLQRELISISVATIGDAYQNGTDVFELIDKAQTEIYHLMNTITSNEPKSISDLMGKVMSEGEIQREKNSDITGVPCMIPEIDSITHGWQNSDLIILAARPAIGKTAFSLNIGLGAAQAGYQGLIFSLEMSGSQLVKRLAANFMDLEAGKIFNTAKMSNDEWGIYVSGAGKLANVQIYIDDTAGITTAQIRAKAFKLVNKGIKLKWLIVDYLQLIGVENRRENRDSQVGSISRDLKKLAKDLDIPIIALSQLNRAGEGKPTLANLRESGSIEQDADVVVMLYNGESSETQDYVVVDFQKHRNGAVGDTVLQFSKTFQRFTSTAPAFTQFPVSNPRVGITGRVFTEPNNRVPDEDAPF